MVLEPALRMKAEADSSSRAQKDFICREEKRKAAWGHAGRPGNRWSCGPNWKLGFYSLFVYCLRVEMSLSADRCFLGRRGVSLANYHLLGPPAVHPSHKTFMCIYVNMFVKHIHVYKTLYKTLVSLIGVNQFLRFLVIPV
jgi:hypothetical protein